MNLKNVVLGLTCVLAVTVAAQSAQAQFLTRHERKAIATAASAWQKEKQPKEQEAQKEQPKQVQETKQISTKADFRIPGREMNMVYSSDYALDTVCKIGQKCWQSFCSFGKGCLKAAQTAATNAAKYGPGGREGAAMRSAEGLVNLLSKDSDKKLPLKEQLRENTDSLAKALEQADLKARQKNASK